MRLSICWQQQCLPYLSLFVRYSESKICRTFTSNFRIVKYKYANGKAACYFLFIGNINVCLIFQRLRDIDNKNMHDIDLDLQNGPRSIAMESMCLYNCWQQLYVPYLSTICEILTVKICMTLTLTFRMGEGQL